MIWYATTLFLGFTVGLLTGGMLAAGTQGERVRG